MGIVQFFKTLFGGNRNVVAETIEVFRENTEAGAQRTFDYKMSAQAQFAQEFRAHNRTAFDSLIDGLNRLPRPMFALGVFGLFGAALFDPIWFTQRMVGLSNIPEPMWWLIGVVLGFYFGGRHQAKSQEFRKSVAASLSRVPDVINTMEALDDYSKGTIEDLDDPTGQKELSAVKNMALDEEDHDDNAALQDWKPQNE